MTYLSTTSNTNTIEFLCWKNLKHVTNFGTQLDNPSQVENGGANVKSLIKYHSMEVTGSKYNFESLIIKNISFCNLVHAEKSFQFFQRFEELNYLCTMKLYLKKIL